MIQVLALLVETIGSKTRGIKKSELTFLEFTLFHFRGSYLLAVENEL
jgi:hypothetical protein